MDISLNLLYPRLGNNDKSRFIYYIIYDNKLYMILISTLLTFSENVKNRQMGDIYRLYYDVADFSLP